MGTESTPQWKTMTFAEILAAHPIGPDNEAFMGPFRDLVRDVGPIEALQRLYANFGIRDGQLAVDIMYAAGVTPLDLEAACLPIMIAMEEDR